jgi:hypothetical protein
VTPFFLDIIYNPHHYTHHRSNGNDLTDAVQ